MVMMALVGRDFEGVRERRRLVASFQAPIFPVEVEKGTRKPEEESRVIMRGVLRKVISFLDDEKVMGIEHEFKGPGGRV